MSPDNSIDVDKRDWTGNATDNHALQDYQMHLSRLELRNKKQMVSWTLESLLYSGIDVNAEGGNFGNALQVASLMGKEDCVRLLLDQGALVNANGGICGTALQAASLAGRADVVQMLLDRGANVYAKGGICGSALEAALFVRASKTQFSWVCSLQESRSTAL
ncbi:hypothetical protein EV356DRAFT_498314, partial [Viridothelium virens]